MRRIQRFRQPSSRLSEAGIRALFCCDNLHYLEISKINACKIVNKQGGCKHQSLRPKSIFWSVWCAVASYTLTSSISPERLSSALVAAVWTPPLSATPVRWISIRPTTTRSTDAAPPVQLHLVPLVQHFQSRSGPLGSSRYGSKDVRLGLGGTTDRLDSLFKLERALVVSDRTDREQKTYCNRNLSFSGSYHIALLQSRNAPFRSPLNSAHQY